MTVHTSNAVALLLSITPHIEVGIIHVSANPVAPVIPFIILALLALPPSSNYSDPGCMSHTIST